MPRRPQLDITETPQGFKIDVPASLAKSGRRERYYYADEKAAKKHQTALRKLYHEHGTKAGAIPPALADAALQAEALLEPLGVSLLDAVRDYVKRNENTGARIKVGDAWNAYAAELVRKGRSDATISDYARDRRSLPDWFLDLKVGEATEEKLGKALDECTRNRGKAWNRKLRECRAVLRAAVRTELKPAEVKRRDPEIITTATARKIMRLATADGCALPFALLCFAGIRPQGELSRISWGNIRRNHIDISGEESKTASDRHIPILPNLRAWIDACDGDDIQPENWVKRYQAIRKAVGITEQDVLRHTFGSAFYRIKGEHEAVQAMGHTSFKTLEKFYRRAVTLAEAQSYFTVAPAGVKIAKPRALRVA